MEAVIESGCVGVLGKESMKIKEFENLNEIIFNKRLYQFILILLNNKLENVIFEKLSIKNMKI